MTKTSAVNATSAGAWQYGNAAGDPFAKEDVQNLGANFDLHDHTSGKGAAISTSQSALAGGSTGGPTTTSASFATIPEMTVTLTTTGGALDVDMVVAVSHSSTTAVTTFAFSLDGAAELAGWSVILGGTGDRTLARVFWTFTGVAAGSHTVTGRWNTSAGTATATSTQRLIRMIERKT